MRYLLTQAIQWFYDSLFIPGFYIVTFRNILYPKATPLMFIQLNSLSSKTQWQYIEHRALGKALAQIISWKPLHLSINHFNNPTIMSPSPHLFSMSTTIHTYYKRSHCLLSHLPKSFRLHGAIDAPTHHL